MTEEQVTPPSTEEDEHTEILTQTNYVPTPYTDQDWEVVGERQNLEHFEPLEMEVVSQDFVVDPMFADYGGVPTEKTPERWHLPEHLAHIPVASKNDEEADAVPTVTIEEEKLQSMLAEAEQRGHAAGLEEAQADFNQKCEGIEQNVNAVLTHLGSQIKDILGDFENQAAKLAIDISRKLIGEVVEIHPEYILEIIDEALKLTGAAAVYKVKVSIQDFEFLELSGASKRIQEFDGSWEFQADESISAGCIVETSAGEIDFQLEQAWERIASKVLELKG